MLYEEEDHIDMYFNVVVNINGLYSLCSADNAIWGLNWIQLGNYDALWNSLHLLIIVEYILLLEYPFLPCGRLIFIFGKFSNNFNYFGMSLQMRV